MCSQKEVASDVISGAAIEELGVDVQAKQGYSRSSRAWVMRSVLFVADITQHAYTQHTTQRRRPTDSVASRETLDFTTRRR